MTLSTSSWHCWLYRQAYGEYATLPYNLCAYFWKVMWAIVSLIPLQLFVLPVRFMTKADRRRLQVEGYASIVGAQGFVTWLGIACVLLVLYAMFIGPFSNDAGMRRAGIVFWCMGLICVAGFYLNRAYMKWKKNYVPPAVKQPNIFVEYAKAFKGKYCPRIEWQKDEL